jgi:hypothetical protein
MNKLGNTKKDARDEKFSLTPSSTNLILLKSEKGREIGEQFIMNLMGIPQQAMDIPAKQKEKIFLTSIEIFKKLSKLANAVDKYADEEAKLVEEFRRKVQKDGKRISHHSDILEAAIEEVLGQAKSTLDVAVKIFEPLLGIKLHTYGENGDKLIKALKNNTPLEDRDKVATIIQVIEQFKPYSETIIGLRTTTQHYKNIQMSPLIALVDEKGTVNISVPKIFQQQTAKGFSETIYHNIFVFIRDLMIFSFASKFYSGIVPVVIEEKGDRIKKIGVTISESELGS